MRPKVAVTNWIHPDLLEEIREFADVEANQSGAALDARGAAALASGADAVIAFMTDRVDGAFLDACPRLKIVAGALKGYDNFDAEACARRGVWLTVVPDLLTVPTAELLITLFLGLTRNVRAGDAHVRSGGFRGWRPALYGASTSGKTFGFIGMGAVARAAARRLGAFGMEMLYFDSRPVGGSEEKALGIEFCGLDELLGASDFVAPLLPLAQSTMHLIGRSALEKFKRGAYLVNVGRGSVVDEEAVADALESGRLAGYAADVFEMEDWARPDRPPCVPPRLLNPELNTLFTPHLGSATDEARRAITREAIAQVRAVLSGRTPPNAVNRPRA